jgi:dihydroxy-acid dehydratase
MGAASTMNAFADALGIALRESAVIPAQYRKRAQCTYKTRKRIVEMVFTYRKSSDIMAHEAFENDILSIQ